MLLSDRGHRAKRGGRHVPCSHPGIRPRATWSAALAACAAATGCAVDVGRLDTLSTRPVVAADLERPRALGRHVEGRSCVRVLLVVPVEPLPSLTDAIDDALAAGGAAVLWDARLRYEVLYVPPFGRGCYVVEGRVP